MNQEQRREIMDRNDHIIAMFRGGMSVREIAYEFLFGRQAIYQILWREGITRQTEARHRIVTAESAS